MLATVDPLTSYKVLRLAIIPLVLFVLSVCPYHASGQPTIPKPSESYSDADRKFGAEYLEQNQQEWLSLLEPLSEVQLRLRPSLNSWSVADILEHVILAENQIYPLVSERMIKEQPRTTPADQRVKDLAVIMAVTNRTRKFTAPEQIRPSGKTISKQELIDMFTKARARTITFVKTTDADLRKFFRENPVMGPIDGFQWCIFLGAHSERHLAQARETIAAPK